MRVFTFRDILRRRINYYLYQFIDSSDIIQERSLHEYKKCLSHTGLSKGRCERETDKLKEQMNRKGLLILPRLVISMTNRCTLCCRDCNNLMPYTKMKYDIPLEEQLEDIEKVFSYVDGIITVELIGGEPFLYKDISTIINNLLNRNVKHIEITTNGTVMPSDELIILLKNEKISVQISDYGNVNGKRAQDMYKRFRMEKINVLNLRNSQWFSAGSIANRHKSKNRLKYEFACCDAKNICRTLYRGRIYVCGRAPVLDEIGLLKDDTSYFDLSKISIKKDKGKREIKNFFLNKYAECCNYCDYASDQLTYIESGIQIKKKN